MVMMINDLMHSPVGDDVTFVGRGVHCRWTERMGKF